MDKAISICPSATELFLRAMYEIADGYMACTGELPTSREVTDFFGHAFYYNKDGIRSKSGNGPYPDDVQKKVFFEKVPGENQFFTQIMQFLEKCLKNVLLDIEEEIASDRGEQVW